MGIISYEIEIVGIQSNNGVIGKSRIPNHKLEVIISGIKKHTQARKRMKKYVSFFKNLEMNDIEKFIIKLNKN